VNTKVYHDFEKKSIREENEKFFPIFLGFDRKLSLVVV